MSTGAPLSLSQRLRRGAGVSRLHGRAHRHAVPAVSTRRLLRGLRAQVTTHNHTSLPTTQSQYTCPSVLKNETQIQKS